MLCSTAGALTPQQYTEQLIMEIHDRNSLDPAIDALDWEGALASLDPKLREQSKIETAEDLRKQEIQRYRGMGDQVVEGLTKALKEAPADKRALLKLMQETTSDNIMEQQAAAKKAFDETDYTVGKTTEEEDEAKVELIKKRGEKTSSATLELVKVGSDWKIKSAAPFSPSGSVGASSNSLLGPPIIMPGKGVVRAR